MSGAAQDTIQEGSIINRTNFAMPNTDPNHLDTSSISARSGYANLVYKSQIDSTNDHAKELVRRAMLSAPAIVLAERQLAGRGQGSRTWLSSSGSLTMSIVEEINVSDEASGLIPMAAALAVCDTLKDEADILAQIKWPNDVWINGKKVSGILVEKVAAGSQHVFVVGIGVNINNHQINGQLETDTQIPETSFEAISLADVSGNQHSITNFVVALLNHWRKLLIAIQSDTNAFLDRINSVSAVMGKSLTLVQPDQKMLECNVVRIGPRGQLIVTNQTNELLEVFSGRIVKAD